ncbi:MAG: outer membrane lipoprotein carrier protein LolA [Flavobacteriales bacterium]|jgi:outer membrane lipoprotein-sorting protein|nr:outer membrane lipoprotein carrier protein LolA [Flavobacteriales bacterium]
MRNAIPFFLLLVFPLFLSAQDWKSVAASDPMLTGLKSTLAGMSSIKGDIRQEKSFAFLTDKLVSTGVFLYQKESKLRWEFKEPIEYIILINENTMRLKEEGVEKKYKGMNQILRQVKEIILGCIDGSIMGNANYKTVFSTDGKSIRIQLQPKEKNLKEFIQQIDVEFMKQGSILKKVTLTDPSGDMTDIHFSNVQSNQKINAALFADF